MNDSGNKNTSSLNKSDEGVRVIEQAPSGLPITSIYKFAAMALVTCLIIYLLIILVPATVFKNDLENMDAQIADQNLSDEADAEATALDAKKSLSARPVSTNKDHHDLSNYVAAGEAPEMKDVINRLHEAGIYEGLGAFSPPGTSPPLMGLAVPDDYVLPEGYVRHTQATDDGQRIEPILMFSPDFEFFDAAGQPIIIPADRVVPPNLAPPGLVIRPIKLPDPLPTGP
jgi:hypothetical protein